MILGLRTDSPEAFIFLYNGDGKKISEYSWVAHRSLARDLLKAVHEQLSIQGIDWEDVTGIVIFKGPGSFTGLRIGATVANTIAHSENIPIVGEAGDDWLASGVSRLKNGKDDKIVLPEYGAPANITQQKK